MLRDSQRLAAVPAPTAAMQESLDRLCALAVSVLGGQQSYASLAQEDRVVAVGASGPREPRPEWPVDATLCVYTLALGVPVLLGDLEEDAVAASHPASASFFRAYAGAAVRVDGERIGSLCVTDVHPRAWTLEDAERLTQLAELAGYLVGRAD